MVVKIIIEVVGAIVLISLSWSFWQCVHSPKYLGRMLSDYNQMKRIYEFFGTDTIRAEGEKLQPVLGSYSANVATWMKSSLSALDTARNTTLFFLVLIIFLSYFLGVRFLLINVGIFFVSSSLPMSEAAKRNMMTDIRMIIINVYKWYSVEPDDCRHFCSTVQPRMFKNIYTLVSESSSASR